MTNQSQFAKSKSRPQITEGSKSFSSTRTAACQSGEMPPHPKASISFKARPCACMHTILNCIPFTLCKCICMYVCMYACMYYNTYLLVAPFSTDIRVPIISSHCVYVAARWEVVIGVWGNSLSMVASWWPRSASRRPGQLHSLQEVCPRWHDGACVFGGWLFPEYFVSMINVWRTRCLHWLHTRCASVHSFRVIPVNAIHD